MTRPELQSKETMFSFEGAMAPCRMTQNYISCKHDIPTVSLLVAFRSQTLRWFGRGKENEKRREAYQKCADLNVMHL